VALAHNQGLNKRRCAGEKGMGSKQLIARQFGRMLIVMTTFLQIAKCLDRLCGFHFFAFISCLHDVQVEEWSQSYAWARPHAVVTQTNPFHCVLEVSFHSHVVVL
jgi:hypothetical protein